MSRTVRIHMTYGETKRVSSCSKGSEVKDLRSVFLQVFSDVVSDHASPADVTFQRYDDSFKDFVELNNDEKLVGDAKLRVLISKLEKQGKNLNPKATEPVKKHLHCIVPCLQNLSESMLWTDLVGSSPVFIRLHSLKQHTNYRLWSPVSRQIDGLMRWDPLNNNVVTCDGSFSGGSKTVMKTSGMARNFVSLIFTDKVTKKEYVITAGNGQGDDIVAEEIIPGVPISDKSMFEPLYFWSYTMFRNKSYLTLYLGCDYSGKTTLVTNSSFDYPNPQALFILNKVVLIADVSE